MITKLSLILIDADQGPFDDFPLFGIKFKVYLQ